MTDSEYLEGLEPPEDDQPGIPDDASLPCDIQPETAEPEDGQASEWDFDENDDFLFRQDDSFDPKDFSEHEDAQNEALAGIVDEETLNAAVEKMFSDDRSYSIPIVDGLFFRGSIAAVYGESHSGKTIFTMGVCDSVSMGEPFGDLGVRCSPVVYLNAESRGDMNKRMAGTLQYRGVTENKNFRIIHGAFDVRHAVNREILIRSLPKVFGEGHRPPLFVFDTLAQHFSGAEGEAIDENSARDVGQFIYGIRDIAERTGGCVILVAHPGKDGDKGIRGSSALRAALDTELRIRSIRPEENSRRILIHSTLTKQRMCDAMEDACYDIKKIMLKVKDDDSEKNGMIDDDDVMITPVREADQFTRVIAPSNQTAVLVPDPMPVPNLVDAKKSRKQDDTPPPAKRKITADRMERAENIRRILNDNFQGEASRASINGIWRHEGFKAVELSAALSDAVSAGLVENKGDGVYKSTIMPSTVGKMGSPADKKNLPAEEF